MVPVQARRFEGVSGKAEIPGVEDSMSSINSFWRLVGSSISCVKRLLVKGKIPFCNALGILMARNAGKL